MCEICRSSPCLNRCPNAADPTPVTHCHRCGEPIIPGDEYGVIDGLDYCEDCIDDMPYCELLPLMGAAIMFAFENTYLELDAAPADRARADMAVDAFYSLWDAIRKVSEDIDRLAGDCRVVDAIYAANDVRRRVGTLKTED